MEEDREYRIKFGRFLIIIITVIIAVGALLFMWFWNGVISDVSTLAEMNYWQSVGSVIFLWVVYRSLESLKSKKGIFSQLKYCKTKIRKL